MNTLPRSVERVIADLRKLPGVGEKTATRYVLFWLQHSPEAMTELAEHLAEVARTVGPCKTCGFLAEAERCALCEDSSRDRTLVCVVETVSDVLAIEKVGEYRGLYHVLGGAISALRGIAPDQLRVQGLLDRVATGEVREVILATGASAEGETTALYLHRVIQERLASLVGSGLSVRVTRPATGIPMGSSIEYLDAITLMRALRGRKDIGG